MIYIIGIIGLIGGFAAGQMLLFFLLRNVSKDDLLNDPYIRVKYGLLNWIIAILGCYATILTYERYFF